MLGFGFCAMVGVGLTWLIFGVVMGRAPKFGIDADILVALSALGTCILSGTVILCCGEAVPPFASMAVTGGLLILCGIVNNAQLLLLSKAMQCGPNGIIWSMTQAGCIVPFAVGIICFSVPLTFMRLTGFAAILISFILIGKSKEAGENPAGGKWKIYALTAFAATGISQTFSNLPSYLGAGEDVGSIWRTFFAAVGMCIAAPIFSACRGEGRNFAAGLMKTMRNKLAWRYVFYLTIFELPGSFFLLYPGMDILVKANAGAIAYPLMVASCIIGFEFFSFFALREVRTKVQFAALLLSLFGVVTICF